MNRYALAVAILTLAGCTTNAQRHVVHGASGIEIDCSGLGSSWEKCDARAAKECKGGEYKVIARSDNTKDEDQYFLGFNPAGYLFRTMLVICR
jgi:hypothetical protein